MLIIIFVVAKSQSITNRKYALHFERVQWGQYHFCKQLYCQLVRSKTEVETYRFFIVADRCGCSSYCCFVVCFFVLKPLCFILERNGNVAYTRNRKKKYRSTLLRIFTEFTSRILLLLRLGFKKRDIGQ